MENLEGTLSVFVGGTGNIGMYSAPRVVEAGGEVWIVGRKPNKPSKIEEGMSVAQAAKNVGAHFVAANVNDRSSVARLAGDVGNHVEQNSLRHVFWHYLPGLHELEYISPTSWPSKEETIAMLNAVDPALHPRIIQVNQTSPLWLLEELHRVPGDQTFAYMSSQAAQEDPFWSLANRIYGETKNAVETQMPNYNGGIRKLAVRAPFFEGAQTLFNKLQALGDFQGTTWEDIRMDLKDVVDPMNRLIYDNDDSGMEQVPDRPHAYAVKVD